MNLHTDKAKERGDSITHSVRILYCTVTYNGSRVCNHTFCLWNYRNIRFISVVIW